MRKFLVPLIALASLGVAVQPAGAISSTDPGTCETRYRSPGVANWNRTDVEFNTTRGACLVAGPYATTTNFITCETRFKMAGQSNWKRYHIAFDLDREDCHL